MGRAMGTFVPCLIVQDGQIVCASNAMAQLLNREGNAEEMLGLDVLTFVHADERGGARDGQRLVLATGAGRTNVRRRLMDERGKNVAVLENTALVEWNGKPAVGISFQPAVRAENESVDKEPPAQHDAFMARSRALAHLSPRQREVALLLSQGFTPTNIAARLGLSVETTRTHVKAIYKKIGISSRIELTRVALGVELPGPRRTPGSREELPTSPSHRIPGQ